MSSPFSTPQEFLEVEGPLYTFANSPIWIAVFLILSVLIFLWFIVASYGTKSGEGRGPNPTVMSILLITSVVSLAESIYTASVERVREEARRAPTARTYSSSRPKKTAAIQRALQLPATLLGISFVTGATQRRKRSRRIKRRP
ncbi:MAG: hypothetical protein ACFB4I_11670 [Cyanophyceae cyanobacterium]